MSSRWGIQGRPKLEGNPLIDKLDTVKSRIMLDINDESFLIRHSDDLDILDVYLVLSAALDYIEDEAEALSRKEGSYLQ
jgi:hypothetical protein